MTWIIIILIAIGYLVGLHGFFKMAGEAGWKAWVPYLRITTWLKLTDKPKWWVVLSFIPLVNLFVYADLLGQSSDSMRRYAWWEHAVIIFLGFLWFPFLTWRDSESYFGARGVKPGQARPPKSKLREWADALVFAIFAAYLIRSFTLELYRIPSPSMEGTLLTGDFLFVSKFHYGARIPNTPIAFPLVHHSFPAWVPFLGGKKAYLEWLKIDYQRLPRIHDVRRNDMVVFNLPVNDTTTLEFDSRLPYYSLIQKYRIYSKGQLSAKKAEKAVRNGRYR